MAEVCRVEWWGGPLLLFPVQPGLKEDAQKMLKQQGRQTVARDHSWELISESIRPPKFSSV